MNELPTLKILCEIQIKTLLVDIKENIKKDYLECVELTYAKDSSIWITNRNMKKPTDSFKIEIYYLKRISMNHLATKCDYTMKF